MIPGWAPPLERHDTESQTPCHGAYVIELMIPTLSAKICNFTSSSPEDLFIDVEYQLNRPSLCTDPLFMALCCGSGHRLQRKGRATKSASYPQCHHLLGRFEFTVYIPKIMLESV